MRLSRFEGTPNIGVYARTNDSLALVAYNAPEDFTDALSMALDVKTVKTTVASTYLVGSLVAMNSHGAVVSDQIEGAELEEISKHIPVLVLSDKLNAAGNNILVNDFGALVNPGIGKRSLEEISNFLKVDAVSMSIAGCSTVGSMCVATNKGCLCCPDASDDDLNAIGKILNVEARRCTVNHGVAQIGAGLVCNSKGALIGDESTPIEMGKIEDGLNLF